MTSKDLTLAQLLRSERDRIVARFVTKLRQEELAPEGASRPLLVDHIPAFIDEIIEEVSKLAPMRAGEAGLEQSEIARQHGGQRWQLGYDLATLVREYEVLQQCILQTAAEACVQLSIDEFKVLSQCSSTGVAEAATQYMRHRDAQLEVQRANLAFIAEAGQVLSSSLDYRSTLAHVVGLAVPRLADGCAIYLQGDQREALATDLPIAHTVPWKADLLREIHRRFPPATDETSSYLAVLRTGEPQLFPEVTAEILKQLALGPEHLALLERLEVRSFMAVPLRVQNHVFGVLALLYTESPRRYGEEDLVLAGELASHAAVAIDNARLFEFSQRERSRVEAATRAKDEFVAMVSHELRTPLHAILGWLELMRNGHLDDAKREHALDVVTRNAQAQNRLVTDLLDISRAITGKLRIHPSQINLRDLIDMAVESVRPAVDAKRIALEVQIHADNTLMRGDPDRLQQVVWNLLVNAVKFTEKGGRIALRLDRVDSDLELTIEDNGAGIEPAFLPHVFDPFRQADAGASRRHSGLGIGLSVARHIAELHGGEIMVWSSGKGRGTTVSLRLPVRPLVSSTYGVSKMPATEPRASKADIPMDGGGLRVLIVDDDADGRELVAFLLESRGMEVHAAASAGEAREQVTKCSPDVILSDIGMPEEDGYALIRSIRTLPNEKLRAIPAIALTAFANNDDRKRALVDGFNAHIAKPVEPALLVRTVLELAGRLTPAASSSNS